MKYSSMRRRRRPIASMWTCRQTLWSLLACLALLGGVEAGRSNVSWPHAVHDELGMAAMVVDAGGSMVVTGCTVVGERFYVAKYTAHGEQLWREAVHVGDFRDGNTDGVDADTDTDSTGDDVVCATAVATDAALNIYVTGTIARGTSLFVGDRDSDVFVARLAPSGSLVWTKTLGTPFLDVATSLCVDDTASAASVFVGGFSAGNLALGRDSKSNCDDGDMTSAGSCDDGFVARLNAADGSLVWVQSVVASASDRNDDNNHPRRVGETRVFDLVAIGGDAVVPSLVLVGETRGSLVDSPRGRHAGDVFVRRVAITTGESLWTTQLTSAGDAAEFCQQPATGAASVTALYTRVYPRGRCGVAVHGTRDISVVGTTQGLISTVPAERQLYQAVCTPSVVCTQLFVARLALDSGAVRWMRQLVHAAHTSGDRVVALPAARDSDTNDPKGPNDHDVAVLATANAGFFTNAESTEQLAVLRVAGDDGRVLWTTELGLAGEDHAVALAVSVDDEDRAGLVVAAHGSDDKSRRGKSSAVSWIRRVHARDGVAVPVCVDRIDFDKTQWSPVTNVTVSSEGDSPTWVARLPLRRDDGARCVDTAAAVRYRYRYTYGLDAPASTTTTTGVVAFASSQSVASIALAVPQAAVSLHVSLEAVSDESQVDETSTEWTIALPDSAAAETGTPRPPRGDDSGTADGRLWQQLTWVALVSAVVATALVVVAGRVVCWRSSAWSWRRARVFQYTTLRLRRPTATTDTTDSATGNDETDELRSHLEEIQQLNDSLDGLLLLTHNGSSSSSSSSSPTSVRSPAQVTPSSPRPKTSGWRRSLRRILPPSPKKL